MSAAAVSAAAAGVAAAAFAAAALVAADLAAAVFAAAVLVAAVFAAAVLVAAVLAVVDLAANASAGVRAETDFALDSDFAAAVRAALVRAAACAPTAFAGGRGGLAVDGASWSWASGVLEPGSFVTAGPSAVGPAAVVDRAAVGLPAVDPADFARAAAGRAAAGLRTAGFRAGFDLPSGDTDDVASAVAAPCRAGSMAPARAPGVGSSGSEL